MSIRIDKDRFLADLQTVSGGLSAREFTEQSSCFVFKDGWLMTFNDEIACRKRIAYEALRGAVPAGPLLDIIEKVTDKNLLVISKKGELLFKGKRKGFAVTKEKKIMLPIDQVEPPGKWHRLPEKFDEALKRVSKCVSGDETKFILTCVHMTPNFIEACDNRQIMRHRMKLGLTESILVRGQALNEIINLGMDSISVTSSWIHFKKGKADSEKVLIYSCRRYSESYPNFKSMMKIEGQDLVIPRGLVNTADNAGVFADDSSSGDPWVDVTLADGRMKVRGEGNSGRYWETRKIEYKGPPTAFIMNPGLLRDIAESYTQAMVSENVLKVTGGKDIDDGGTWEYVARLGKVGEDDDEDEEATPKKKKKRVK